MTSAFSKAKSIFQSYQQSFENFLSNQSGRFEFLESPSFGEACNYTLSSGGKRFRPILVLMVADACGKGNAFESALSVELFHTASLVIDDLPCMDDEQERRGAQTLHSKFGEGTAILTTYALIAEAFDCLRKNASLAEKEGHPYSSSHNLLSLALQNVCHTLGLRGVTGGQYLDLYCEEPTPDLVKKTLEMKTGALFETSFVLGWLFGGGNPDLLPRVVTFAHHFGRAFQIADDLDDFEEDFAVSRLMNLAVSIGKEEAFKAFEKSLKDAELILGELNLQNSNLALLCEYLKVKGNS